MAAAETPRTGRLEPDGEEPGALRRELSVHLDRCTRCGVCQVECQFLTRHGTPGALAETFDPADSASLAVPFECSLCRLCAAVCPEDLDPSRMFLEMRREAVRRDLGEFPEHAPLLAYERKGTSKLFTYYALPFGCDTVFFPGCALPGTRPERVLWLYRELRARHPSLGIVLDCCAKPSHDLGRQAHFEAMFREMEGYLIQQGVRHVWVACPNCHRVFRGYSRDLATRTVYEVMAEEGIGAGEGALASIQIHDPCALRFEDSVHRAVRDLLASCAAVPEEGGPAGRRTLCCGEGGAAGCLSPELADLWADRRVGEAAGRPLVTYCAGCAHRLGKRTSTSHVLDWCADPAGARSGGVKAARPPLTYWNRLKLKRALRKTVEVAVSRERDFVPDGVRRTGSVARPLLLLAAVLAAVVMLRVTGFAQYLGEQQLQALLLRLGIWAPLVYMLVYAVAPALFLPGLPISIVGGVLFGPFWGVVYTIIGSTTGACVAFLVARYVARDWVRSRLVSPRWRGLDQQVAQHGWKVVAFARLIPLFPFNLLNYALGLTGVRFLPYALATFVCMLPACIAFIVFSSSLLDLVQGRVSPRFLVGLAMVGLISLIPLLYRRLRRVRG